MLSASAGRRGFGAKGFGSKGKDTKVPSESPAVARAHAAADAPRAPAPDVTRILSELDESQDIFWQLIGPILSTDPALAGVDLSRVAALVDFSRGRRDAIEADPAWRACVADPFRPHAELHAYMPGIVPASAWHDPAEFTFAAELEAHHDVISREFDELLRSNATAATFQHVTEMNYDAGWKTLVLRYNGGRIARFPYELCPTTTAILDSIPIAGRIAGFNRQLPTSGIPLHSDGNNMWLTLQMGIKLPNPERGAAERGAQSTDASRARRPWIRVGSETRHWDEGKCLVYDTTFEHETFNPSADAERIVLHVDFWNTISTRRPEARAAAAAAGALSDGELVAMRKIYSLREQFLKAEGVGSVAAQRLGN
jgi:aspartyl/asparaginyl beta-hydroxylase (cupin superfamily)